MSHYQDTIRRALGNRDYDPRHIEAYLRLQHGTLDHLSTDQMRDEIEVCVLCVDADGEAAAESLADTYAIARPDPVTIEGLAKRGFADPRGTA